MFTPLHRALGLAPGAVNFSLITSAIAGAVEETDDLDWKAVLPTPDKHEEFAKDVAAMANSGGGLIVYGVAEKSGPTSAAGAVRSVVWSDGEERRLRQVAYNMIQPPVYGVRFLAVQSDGDVVVLCLVDPSPDAPHLVWAKERFNAPRRYGAQTVTMAEREIERAYRARFAEAEDRQSEIAELAAHATRGVDISSAVWIVLTAVPTNRRPLHVGRVEKRAITDLVIRTRGGGPFEAIDLQVPLVDVNPRPRYRMWRSEEARGRALLECHDDGSLVYARSLRPPRGQEEHPTHLHPMDLQGSLAHLFWLLRGWAQTASVESRFVIRAELRTTLPEPVRFLMPSEWGNGLTDADQVEPVHEFQPVEVVVDPLGDLQGLLDALRDFTTDVLNQGGIEGPGTFYIKPEVGA